MKNALTPICCIKTHLGCPLIMFIFILSWICIWGIIIVIIFTLLVGCCNRRVSLRNYNPVLIQYRLLYPSDPVFSLIVRLTMTYLVWPGQEQLQTISKAQLTQFNMEFIHLYSGLLIYLDGSERKARDSTGKFTSNVTLVTTKPLWIYNLQQIYIH